MGPNCGYVSPKLRHAGLGAMLLAGLAFSTADDARAHWTGLTPTIGAETSFSGENPTCGDLSDVPYQYEFKIDNEPTSGQYTDPNAAPPVPLVVDMMVREDATYGWLVDWVKNAGTQVNAVIVKGGAGSGGNYYTYLNQPPNVPQDANLHAAIKNSKGQGISHVTFCYSIANEDSYDGCTLGYWKNHKLKWPAGYFTTTKLTTVGFVGAPKPYDFASDGAKLQGWAKAH